MKKIIKTYWPESISIIITAFVIGVGSITQGLVWLPPVFQSWLSANGAVLPYDKLEHFLVWVPLGFINIKLGIYLALVNEIKDSLWNYEVYGLWGGEGFDYKDFIASVVGTGIGWFVRKKIFTQRLSKKSFTAKT